MLAPLNVLAEQFPDFLLRYPKEANQPGFHWQDNELPGTV